MTTSKSNALSFRFQTITLTISTIIILMLVGGQLEKFCSIDQAPTITPISPKTVKQFLITPVEVETGLTITDFPQFNVATNNFQINGIIWFTFDPSLISLSTIEKFSFVRGHIDSKSPPITTLENNRITVRYAITATFRTQLYYGFFPFEDHTMHIMIANSEVDPDEVIFKSRYANFIIDKPYTSGWDYEDHRVISGFGSIPLGIGEKTNEILYPAVLFEIDFFHHSIRYVFTVLLPLMIIFFIDLFSFCFDQRKDNATLVAMTTANLAALVGYRFVIQTMTPAVGYPTAADYMYFLFLGNTFVIFVINCVGPYLTILQKKIISIVLQTIIVSALIYILGYWIPC